MPWVRGAGVELWIESGQPPNGAFLGVRELLFRALYVLRASPRKLAELRMVPEVAETPRRWVWVGS